MSKSDYGGAMPYVQAHMGKYQRAVDGVRATHRGRPMGEVLAALTVAFEAEGIEVWDEVKRDAARLISAA